MNGSEPAPIYGILEDDANRLLSRAATTVQTKVEAGHKSNLLEKGPALRLIGCQAPRHDSHYDKTETIEQFKTGLVASICDTAVFPASSAETECEALREALQTAVDACEVDAPETWLGPQAGTERTTSSRHPLLSFFPAYGTGDAIRSRKRSKR